MPDRMMSDREKEYLYRLKLEHEASRREFDNVIWKYWRQRENTQQIAVRLGLKEHVVANRLPRLIKSYS